MAYLLVLPVAVRQRPRPGLYCPALPIVIQCVRRVVWRSYHQVHTGLNVWRWKK